MSFLRPFASQDGPLHGDAVTWNDGRMLERKLPTDRAQPCNDGVFETAADMLTVKAHIDSGTPLPAVG